MRIRVEGRYQRKYNTPAAANEVVAIFRSSDDAPLLDQNIQVYEKARSAFKTLNVLDPNTNPMSYPLLFSHGESGWTTNMPHHQAGSRGNNVTLLQFYSYRFAVRPFDSFLNAGKLTQQYIVDAYVKVEINRLQL